MAPLLLAAKYLLERNKKFSSNLNKRSMNSSNCKVFEAYTELIQPLSTARSTNLLNTCCPPSSVASSICQEGQSERNFPISAFLPDFSSVFSRFFLIFSLFFPNFGKFLLSGVALCHPSGYATVPACDKRA